MSKLKPFKKPQVSLSFSTHSILTIRLIRLMNNIFEKSTVFNRNKLESCIKSQNQSISIFHFSSKRNYILHLCTLLRLFLISLSFVRFSMFHWVGCKKQEPTMSKVFMFYTRFSFKNTVHNCKKKDWFAFYVRPSLTIRVYKITKSNWELGKNMGSLILCLSQEKTFNSVHIQNFMFKNIKQQNVQPPVNQLLANSWEQQMYLDVAPQSASTSGGKVSNLLNLGLGREKRSFRRQSEQPADHSLTAALLDAAPLVKRQGSHRASKTKKAFFLTMSLLKNEFDSPAVCFFGFQVFWWWWCFIWFVCVFVFFFLFSHSN